MVKRRFSKQIFRAVVLIAFGVVLFSVAPANRPVIVSIPSPTASPTPVATPEVKRRNSVRRFFSSVFQGIAGVFRRSEPRGPGCNLPPFVILTPSSSSITLCPRFQVSPSQSCSPSSEVKLSADVPGAENNELLFTWSVTGGRLRGEGHKVTWDLDGLAEGTYTASVEVNAGNQLTSVASTTVRITACTDCVWRESPCATVTVVCPSGVESTPPTYFEAATAGGYTTLKPTYKWSLSAGKISSGQGTSKIVVDVSALAGKSVTATVQVGGYDPRCKEIMVASCTTEVGQ